MYNILVCIKLFIVWRYDWDKMNILNMNMNLFLIFFRFQLYSMQSHSLNSPPNVAMHMNPLIIDLELSLMDTV